MFILIVLCLCMLKICKTFILVTFICSYFCSISNCVWLILVVCQASFLLKYFKRKLFKIKSFRGVGGEPVFSHPTPLIRHCKFVLLYVGIGALCWFRIASTGTFLLACPCCQPPRDDGWDVRQYRFPTLLSAHSPLLLRHLYHLPYHHWRPVW